MMSSTSAVKNKVRLIVDLQCNDGSMLPLEQQTKIYWVVHDLHPHQFVCSGTTAEEAMRVAREECDWYFAGDPEDVRIRMKI